VSATYTVGSGGSYPQSVPQTAPSPTGATVTTDAGGSVACAYTLAYPPAILAGSVSVRNDVWVLDASTGAVVSQVASVSVPPPNPVAQENRRPGTTAWQLTHPADNRQIEGYASLTSVPDGGTIDLFVNTQDATYSFNVYRMGWYGGRGGRQVLKVKHLPGVRQVTPTADPTTGIIECHWINPYHLGVPTSWLSGIYLVKLHGDSSGLESYIIFTVRDSRQADVVFQQSVTTYEAYNPWPRSDPTPDAGYGGYVGASLYSYQTAVGTCSAPSCGPQGQQASQVSFDRPYGRGLRATTLDGVGAGDFLTHDYAALNGGIAEEAALASGGPSAWEFGMLRWLEHHGYDVTYITNVDTHEDLGRLLRGKVFLSVGHDEYWSERMRQNVVAARDQGVSLGFFSANYIYWPVNLLPDSGQSPDRTIALVSTDKSCDFACTKDTGGSSETEQSVVGGMWDGGHSANGDIVVRTGAPLDHWIFANSGLQVGDVIPGLIGYEYNVVRSDFPEPSGLQTLLQTQAPDFCCALAGPRPGIPFAPTFDGKDFDGWYDAGGTLVNTCQQDPIPPLNIDPSSVSLCSNPYPQIPGMKQDWATTIYQASSGAWVFNAGTIQWAWGLDDYFTGLKTGDGANNGPALRTQCGYSFFHPGLVSCRNSAIEQITSNVLNRFISGH
jgi:hypothetical protein